MGSLATTHPILLYYFYFGSVLRQCCIPYWVFHCTSPLLHYSTAHPSRRFVLFRRFSSSKHRVKLTLTLSRFTFLRSIHSILDSRTGLSLVERSRQRNPQQQQQAGGQLRVHYDPRVQQPIYTQQQQQQQQAYLIQQQQQFQAYPPAGGFPSSLPSSLPSQLAGVAIPQQQGGGGAQQFIGHVTTGSDDPSASSSSSTAATTGNRGRVNSVSALSSLSLVSPGQTHPSNPSLGYFSHQEKLQQLESELEEYENELAEERRLQQQERASSSSSASSTTSTSNQLHPHQQQQQQVHQQGGYYQDQDQDDLMDDMTFSATHSAVQSPQGDTMNDDEDDPNTLYQNQPLSLDPEEAARQAAAAEEDKRRRNTAASARFRQKKRLREQILEKTAKEMTAKSEILEARARELEMEIKWLRGLIVEKGSASVGLQGVGPAVLPGGVGVGPGGVGLLSSSLPNSSSFLGPDSFAGSSKAAAAAARRPRKVPPPLAAKPAPPSN